MGIPDVSFNKVSKGDIKRAVIEHNRPTIKGEVEASRKKGDRSVGEKSHNTYLSYMTLPNSRIWIHPSKG